MQDRSSALKPQGVQLQDPVASQRGILDENRSADALGQQAQQRPGEKAHMHRIPVRQIMTSDIVTIGPDQLVADAAETVGDARRPPASRSRRGGLSRRYRDRQRHSRGRNRGQRTQQLRTGGGPALADGCRHHDHGRRHHKPGCHGGTTRRRPHRKQGRRRRPSWKRIPDSPSASASWESSPRPTSSK